MKKIKILHVVNSMNLGGIEVFLMNALRNIDTNRFQFIFLCVGSEKFSYENEIISLGGKIVRIPEMTRWNKLKFVNDIRKVIQEEAVDIVHVHTYFKSVYPLFAAKVAGVRVRIVHSHQTAGLSKTPNILRRILYTVLKFPINIYSTTKVACSDLAGSSLFYRRYKFMIIENAIKIEDYSYSKKKRLALRKSFNIPNDAKVIGAVGRIVEIKNLTFLINIFYEYMKNNKNSYLFLVGDGPLRIDLQKQAISLGLEENVIFAGVRSNVNELYNVMDILILPSFSEGLGIVLIEAQANGLKCIASDAVSRAANITGLVDYQPLSNGASRWANVVEETELTRVDNTAVMEKSTYNISSSIGHLQDLYTRLNNQYSKKSTNTKVLWR